jgi:hypothetical protein
MLPTKFWFIWPGGFRGEDSESPDILLTSIAVSVEIFIFSLQRDLLKILINDIHSNFEPQDNSENKMIMKL